jgi:hypothetical protein
VTARPLAAASSNYKRAEKPGTTSRASTTTLTADPDLTLPILDHAKYEFELLLRYECDTAGKLNLRVTGPSSALLFGVGQGIAGGNVATTVATATQAALMYENINSSPGQVGGCGAGIHVGYRIAGTLTTIADAGSIGIEWAQGASSATATQLFTRSSLSIVKVS